MFTLLWPRVKTVNTNRLVVGAVRARLLTSPGSVLEMYMDESSPSDTGQDAPRIVDVARAAGVSTATVSRVLSNSGIVSVETRANVLAAVAQTGYRINFAARNLRRRQTGGIVVLVPYLANPFFSRILSGIAHVASRAKINVLVVDTKEPRGADRQIVEYLDDNRADGLIVLDGTLPESIFSGSRRPPIVFACEWVEGHDQPSVTIDNRLGAQIAMEHLIALGHRHIGHLYGPMGNVLREQRAAGARLALDAAGLPYNPDWFFEGDFTLASGIACAQQWLALETRPTAVFSSSDAMAFGFMSELHRHGIRIPEDVSIVGFDDIEFAANFIPPLTTVRQPRITIGETAAEMLLDLMRPTRNDRASKKHRAALLPIELVVRASTAAPART